MDQSVPKILTAYTESRVTEFLLDGISVKWEHRGQRAFVVLPSLGDGEHSLMTLIGSKEEKEAVQKHYEILVKSGNILIIQNIPLTSIPLKVEIFDINGRRIRHWSNIELFPPNESLHLSLPELPAGMYIINIKREKESISRRITIVR